MLIREFGSNDANPINNIMKGKRSALGNFMSKKLAILGAGGHGKVVGERHSQIVEEAREGPRVRVE